jgi:predicted GIY-YIG superfamily endonuclease
MGRDPAGPGVYLLHFDEPYEHARHYLGWAASIRARVAQHRRGNGARLMAVITAAGIGFEVARTWPGADRTLEAALKRRHNTPRLCPLCQAPPQPGNRRARPVEDLAAVELAEVPEDYGRPF